MRTVQAHRGDVLSRNAQVIPSVLAPDRPMGASTEDWTESPSGQPAPRRLGLFIGADTSAATHREDLNIGPAGVVIVSAPTF